MSVGTILLKLWLLYRHVEIVMCGRCVTGFLCNILNNCNNFNILFREPRGKLRTTWPLGNWDPRFESRLRLACLCISVLCYPL